MSRFEPLFLRTETKAAIREYAERKRMPMSQAADVAVRALSILTLEQENALIEKRAVVIPDEVQPEDTATSAAHQ